MNTIPLIFDEKQINISLIENKMRTEKKFNITAVLLSTSALTFHAHILDTLSHIGFSDVISLELSPSRISSEDVAKKFPFVKFIMPLEKATIGEMVNIACRESEGEAFLVLRDTLSIAPNFLPTNLANTLLKKNKFCITPRLVDAEKNPVAMQMNPIAERGKFRVHPSTRVQDEMNTLYPFDYIGLYNKKKFMSLAGFDYTIVSPYYQNLDLSLRAWLWGEEIIVSTPLLFSYAKEAPIEDVSSDTTYLHFYLKNLAPKYKIDKGAFIPCLSFLNFLKHSSCGFFESKREFSDARKWVKTNSARFCTDLEHLIQNWKTLV